GSCTVVIVGPYKERQDIEEGQSQEEEDVETVESDPTKVTVKKATGAGGSGSDNDGATTAVNNSSSGGNATSTIHNSGSSDGYTTSASKSASDDNGKGGILPSTATNAFNWIVGGFLAMFAGAAGIFTRRKKKDNPHKEQ